MSGPGWIEAKFGAPSGVRAGVSTRAGGVSTGGCSSLNLAAHVGDAVTAVATNRALLKAHLGLPAEPMWLTQVHGVRVFEDVGAGLPTEPYDAAVTGRSGVVLAVLTADCLPVVFASRDGRRLGVAHAGWRGLLAGVLEATVQALGDSPQNLVVWLGPAIGVEAFEVGEEVRAAFLAHDPHDEVAFIANARGRWQADLTHLAQARLSRIGVTQITASGICTYRDPDRFFSHRRDPGSGRMATLVWREPEPGRLRE
jgi:YfiH family protein